LALLLLLQFDGALAQEADHRAGKRSGLDYRVTFPGYSPATKAEVYKLFRYFNRRLKQENPKLPMAQAHALALNAFHQLIYPIPDDIKIDPSNDLAEMVESVWQYLRRRTRYVLPVSESAQASAGNLEVYLRHLRRKAYFAENCGKSAMGRHQAVLRQLSEIGIELPKSISDSPNWSARSLAQAILDFFPKSRAPDIHKRAKREIDTIRRNFPITNIEQRLEDNSNPNDPCIQNLAVEPHLMPPVPFIIEMINGTPPPPLPTPTATPPATPTPMPTPGPGNGLSQKLRSSCTSIASLFIPFGSLALVDTIKVGPGVYNLELGVSIQASTGPLLLSYCDSKATYRLAEGVAVVVAIPGPRLADKMRAATIDLGTN